MSKAKDTGQVVGDTAPSNKAQVLEETRHAYVEDEYDWKASLPVTRDEAFEIAKECVGGWNDFRPALIKLLPPDAQIWFARESSVCLYVRSDSGMAYLGHALCADEFEALDEKTWRIWWD